jgi:predicted extracellular nuclease
MVGLITSSRLPAATPVFINEIHYDNSGTDIGEAIEIAGPAGADLTGWSIVLYNGSSSVLAPYDSRTLSGNIDDLGSGFGVVVENYPTNGIQNGGPDGMALVDAGGDVVQFLSYEGSFTAVGGPADGLTSTDIGVSESSSTPAGFSLQLVGSGSVYEDFSWSPPAPASFDAVNTEQQFSDTGGEPHILINEVDSDTAGTDTLEFIELYDGGAGNTDLSGLVVVLYNGNGDISYASFDLDGYSTDANGYFVLGNAVVPGVDLVFNDNSLQNGADAVALYEGDAADFPNGTLVVAATTLIDAVVYDTSDADDAGLLVLLQAGEPQVDENGNGNKDFESMQRCPNGVGAGGQTSGFQLFEPTADGPNVCVAAPPVVEIYTVQGSGRLSPLVGTTVTVSGIVTGDFQDGSGVHGDANGFYVQAVPGDGDDATSDGIFVFDGSLPAADVGPGDRVEVTGTVVEFFGETQINATVSGGNVTIASNGNPLPVTTPIYLGASVGVIPNADGELIADLEQYEGMLVHFPQTLSVSELFNLDRFGELRLAEGGRFFQFTNGNAPDVTGFQAHLEDVARRNLMLDDGLLIQNPDPIRYPSPELTTANTVRMGDTVTGVSGNLRFSRGSGGSGDETYRLMPTAEPTFISGNPRPLTAVVGGELRVASFNVLNFFNDLDDGTDSCFPSGTTADCRGADSQLEYDRQLQKLVTALAAIDADIVGLIELENDYPDGESSSIAHLVAALNGAPTTCAGNYEYVAPPGGGRVGDDAIAVGFIYCANTVAIAPGTVPAILEDSALPGLGLAGPVFNGEATNRSPLAVSFQQLGTSATLTVVVNHFKSKGASTLDDTGTTCGVDIDPALEPNCDRLDGQGYWNARRTEAAEALSAWLATAPTGSSDPDVLIIGDLNAYPQEDPLTFLKSQGYTNLNETLGGGATAYSFVFDAQAGLLDYALASHALSTQVTGVVEWQINADEPDALDYNLNFGRNPGIFDGTVPYRASDHDAIILGLSLFNEIVGTERRDVLVGTDGNDRITGGPGRDNITTEAGNDILVYESVTDGGDIVTDFEVGADRIDLSALLTSLGYTGSDPFTDGYVVVVPRGALTMVLLDTDGDTGRSPARPFILLQGVGAAALNDRANFIF